MNEISLNNFDEEHIWIYYEYNMNWNTKIICSVDINGVKANIFLCKPWIEGDMLIMKIDEFGFVI